jgi:hypothetical protein
VIGIFKRLKYRLRRKDGEYRWAIDAASPRFGEGGEFLGYIGSVIDITERKQMEAERERLLAVDEHGNVIEIAVTGSARVSSLSGRNCESCAAAGSAPGRRRNSPRDLRPHKFSKETLTRPLPHRHPYPVNAQIDLWFIGGARAGRREPEGA